ncbi:hypothetical protein F5878DRAFT_666113 [Lentinula raphanica]|uniref:Uncharacterized protein n=1 Tax=Lentinula raphanica TaxID=153919 RepID=A0AA38NYE2_9AGAR|nr:hypothetical protein F5880DRAFT_1617643 [Lentinula raphanica]KAJ3832928.1 hypothetical protein F5878DRAFT_666113 [Lentinula raphanica]
MSQASAPMIPFVVISYHNMETHLHQIMAKTTIHPSLPKAAEVELKKLLKYKIQADLNQYYVLGTILHPSLHSTWFEQYVGNTLFEKQCARKKAKAIFEHIAEEYFKNQLEVEKTSEI